MLETPGIPLRQALWLFINSRLIITLVFIPAFSELPHQDVLLSMIAAIPMTILYALIFVTLWLQYPKQTLIEYSTSILGRFLGKAIGILYIWYFIHHAAITLRIFDDFLATRFFTQTPMEVIGVGILLVSAYVIYKGLETLGRCADALVPVILFGIVLIVVLVINQAEWKNVTPFLEKGIGPMLFGAVPTTTRWAELAWIAMIIPFIVNKQKIKGAIFGGIVIVNVFFLILMVPIVAVFGITLAANTQFPSYALVEVIQIGRFLERIEALVLGLWVFGAFLKISIFYYVAVLGAAQWFGLKERKPLILPIGLIIFSLSLLLFSNIVELRAFGNTLVSYDFTMVFIIPLMMLIIHFVKKRFKVSFSPQ
jgi:spore germination protein KB